LTIVSVENSASRGRLSSAITVIIQMMTWDVAMAIMPYGEEDIRVAG